LVSLGFNSGRMKTGTPPRIDGRSLDYDKMEAQVGDSDARSFSFLNRYPIKKQRDCHITYTNNTVHEIINDSISQSPLYNGQIQSIGPRYCPSVEDKVQRFADKDRHQIFVEPEGWKTHEVYVNGFSTSLPLEVQQKAIKHIPGFENAVLFRPGYAIEYDFFPPTQLNLSLETKNIQNLFFAGQINGTTGYEEAAAQGLMAGINAHRKNTSQEALVLTREQAYIGVLIDDLITKGTDEPYRMFTSRAEYRITLRQDSADIRLTPIAHELGLVSDERMDRLKEKEKQKTSLLRAVKKSSITPTEANDYLIDQSSKPISQSVKIESLLLRPNVKLEDLIPLSREFSKTNASGHYQEEVIEATEVLIKYAGYIKREREMAQKMLNLDKVKIPTPFNFEIHQSISTESREKLQQHQPVNLGQASRIPGVKPVDISVLMIALEKHVSHET